MQGQEQEQRQVTLTYFAPCERCGRSVCFFVSGVCFECWEELGAQEDDFLLHTWEGEGGRVGL